jgi:hypothetical protein
MFTEMDWRRSPPLWPDHSLIERPHFADDAVGKRNPVLGHRCTR